MCANFAGTSAAKRKRLAEFSVATAAEDDAIRDSDSRVWQPASSRSVEKSSASYNRIETRISAGCAEVRWRQDSDHGAQTAGRSSKVAGSARTLRKLSLILFEAKPRGNLRRASQQIASQSKQS